MDTENLVLVVFGGLNQSAFDIFRAGIKIYGCLQGLTANETVNVGAEPDFQVILVDSDFFNHQLQIVPLQLVLVENVLKHLQRQLSRPIHTENGVAPVGNHVDLMADTFHLLLKLRLQFIIGLLN